MMESWRKRIVQKVLIFVLFSSGTVLAQFRTANLSGTVVDEAGIPLQGVEIKVTFLTPSRDFVGPTLVREVWSGLTEEDGNYRVSGLLLGSYQIEASSAGFDTHLRWAPLRTSADEMILDITLKAADIPIAVQRPTSLPGPESREPVNELVPVATNESDRISLDAQLSPPPAEPPPSELPPAELPLTKPQPPGPQPTGPQPTAEPLTITPNLLGELNWLWWAAPFSVLLLFLLLGTRRVPGMMNQERKEGVSKEIEPPKVTVSTRIKEPVQVEQERQATRVKEPPTVQKPVRTQREVETKKVEKPVPVQREIPTKRGEPVKVETFSNPLIRQMEDHFGEQGETVTYPLLSEKVEYVIKGFQIAYKPGTRQEVWITHSSGDHIMMLKPK